MSMSLNLLKKLALLTLIAGISLPTNIAKADSFTPANRASTQPGNLESKELTGEPSGTESTSVLLLSKKAQQIGFFTFLFLSGCSLSLVATEFFHKHKKNNQSLKSGEIEENQWEKITEIEQKIRSLKEISEPQTGLALFPENPQEFKRESEKLESDHSKQERKAA